MPKKLRELEPLQVRRLSQKPGLHAVGGVAGLFLQVKKNPKTGTVSRASWILRYTTGEVRMSEKGNPFAKRRDIGLGSFPSVTLAQARASARAIRERLNQGVDPIEEKRAKKAARLAEQAKAITFDEAARKFLASKTREFRNPKHATQWKSTLEIYASPVIGNLPVARVELAHIIQILEPIWIDKTETASRLRGRIESVLAWATVSGFREGDNPARWKGNLDAVLPKPGKLKRVTHFKAVPVEDAPSFVVDLRTRKGVASRALEFLILTAARSGEVRGATWDEIDLDAKMWTIPAERMKARREHIVPLCDDALALLKALPRPENSNYVFTAVRGGQLSDATLSAVMKRMNRDATVHGWRSTFRDWCAEHTNYPREVAEKALAHQIPNPVERAYQRGDLIAKRTRLMQDWARFLNSPAPVGEVVTMNKVASAT